jgi:hypothetical protein
MKSCTKDCICSAWKAQKAISAEEGLIAIPYERKQVILLISPLELEILVILYFDLKPRALTCVLWLCPGRQNHLIFLYSEEVRGGSFVKFWLFC